MNIFINQLADYVKKKNRESFCFFWNTDIIDQSRVTFIQNCLSLIKEIKESPPQERAITVQAMTDYLKEEDIQIFKGFFSQRLYDILKKYPSPTKRKEAILKETPLPEVLVNLIGEYDDIFVGQEPEPGKKFKK